MLFFFGAAHATSYAYDGNGRLVAVTNDDGTSGQYTYDALGNIVRVSNVPAGQLALFAFTPTHGVAGTSVTLYGQGFSTTAAANTVTFGGVATSVRSATANQLLVNVPDGAATGPVSVAVGGQSTTSDTPFVVDDTGLPPTITQVSPNIAAVGDTVTLTGAYLYPRPGDTSVRMGGRGAEIRNPSNNQLSILVPRTLSSGHVAVQTPYGFAESADIVLVPPVDVTTASIVSRGAATIDVAPVSLSIPQGGQIGAVLFDSHNQQWLSLQASAITTSAQSITYKVYAPGNVLVQQGSISAGAPSVHLPQLHASGTYLVTFQPDTAGAQLTIGVDSNPTLTTGVVATETTNAVGQSKRMLFPVQAGQTLAFQIDSMDTNPAGQPATYTVYEPDGTPYTSGTTASAGLINLPNLPVSGTYQVIAAPNGANAATMQVGVIQGTTGALSPGTPQTYTANAPGQNIYLNFAANTTDSLELVLSQASVTGAYSEGFTVNVYNQGGAQVASTWCYPNQPNGNCNLHLWYLSKGTYTVVATPVYGGTLHFDALLQPQLTGPSLAINSTTSLSLDMGQVERFTFNANAGDTVALQVSGVTTTPGGQPIQFLVYRPDAGAITVYTPAYSNFSPSAGQLVNLPDLPVSGTYTVIAIPAYGLPGSAQLSLVSGVTGTIPADGTVQTYNANAPGENIYLKFAAKTADNLELVLSNASVTGAYSDGFTVNVYNHVGVQVASTWCYPNSPNGNCNLHLWYMAADTYSVTVTPVYGGTLHFDTLIQPNVAGTPVAMNGTENVSLGMAQVERFTFNANVGDTVALQVAGVATTPPGQTMQFLVYRPDVGAITVYTPAYSNFSPSAGQLVNLPDLPVSGTYTVIAIPAYGLSGNAQFSLVPGVTGGVPPGSPAQTYNANAPGENVYLNFTANTGDNLEFVLSNMSVVGAYSDGFIVSVYNHVGAQVASTWCYPNSPGSSCNLHLWNLAADTYSVIATPPYGGSLHFDALVQPNVEGPSVAMNSTASMSLGAGQVERFTFDGSVGETVALQVTGVTTTPAGQPIQFLVYRPDAGVITVNTPAYSNFSPTDSQLVNLPNLPVSGTYTVIAIPAYGLAGSAQLSLVPGVTGGLPPGAPAQTYNANAPGENVYLSFTAKSADNLELVLSHMSVTGAYSDGFIISVYNQVGAQVASTWCYPNSPNGNCNLHLWYMAAGNYSVIATPTYGGTLHFDALVQPNLAGPSVPLNGTTNLSLGMGQVERFTFSANAGDTVGLQVSGVTTTPTGQPIQFLVYRPDAGAITVNTPTFSNFSPTDGQLVSLPSVPVSGTYTVIAVPAYGLPGSAKFKLASQSAGVPPTTGSGTLPPSGVAQSYAAVADGQNVTLSFDANLGENLELTFNNINVTDTGTNAFQVDIYSAGGGNVSEFYCYSWNFGNSCAVHLWNLAAGTYSVVVSPYWGGRISFDALLTKDTIGSKLTPSVPTDVSLSAGEVKRLTFDANLGDTVALQLSDVATTPGGGNVTIRVYRPDTGAISPENYYTYSTTSSTSTLNLSNLPVGGTYTVTVEATDFVPASAQLTVFPGVTGGVLTSNNVLNQQANTDGQNVYMTFDAALGDNLELTLKNINVVDNGTNAFQVDIYNANGSNVTEYYCYGWNLGNSCMVDLWNLSAGTYSVTVSPYWGGKVAFDALLTRNTIGPKLAPSVPTDVSVGAGQVKRLTFDANLGDTVALQLNNVSTTPVGRNVTVKIYRPDTGAITPANYYTYIATSGTSTLNLPNLPVGGTYTVTVEADYGLPASAQLTVFPGATGAVLNENNVLSQQANVDGQNVYMNFKANLGDNLQLTFNNINVVDTGTNAFQVDIFSANGTNILEFYCYSWNRGNSCLADLWNLSAGTYSVVVSPYWGGKITFDALLTEDTIGPKLTRSIPTDISVSAGQVKRLTFDANLGETVALQLSDVATTPEGGNVTVKIYRPDTGAITPASYYTYISTSNTSTLNLSNLPVGGTYTVTVEADYGIPASAQLTVFPGVTDGVLTDGVVLSEQANVVGQNVYLTFHANLGDNRELTFNNVNVADGSYQAFQVDVYSQNGTNVSEYYCYASNPGSSCIADLWNLAAGNYSVVISPYWGGKVGFNALLTSDVTVPPLVLNESTDMSLETGQVKRSTFNADEGGTAVLQLSGVNTTPGGRNVTVKVYRPDVGAITPGNYYTYFSASIGDVLNLTNLPIGGTYTVVVYADYGVPAAARLGFSNTVGTIINAQ